MQTDIQEQQYLEWLQNNFQDGDIRVKAYNIAKKYFGPQAFNLYTTNGYKKYLDNK